MSDHDDRANEAGTRGTDQGPVALRRILSKLADQADEDIDLGEAALTLAAVAHPAEDPAPYREHLDALVASVARGAAEQAEGVTTAADRAEVLHRVLSGEWDYHGDVDSYEDPQNADLMRVIDRRKGLPVTLGILSLHVARAQGWKADGLNFPGHFLVRLETEDGDRVIIDPFHDNRIVSVADMRALLKAITDPAAELTPEHYAVLGNRDILLRLQNSIKLRHLEAGRYDRALHTLKEMLLISPNDHRLWREAGLMHMRTGDLEGAIESLDRYLELAPEGSDRDRIDKVMRELRQRLQ